MTTAVITGAGRGIGRSCALAFARRGFDVALCARTKPQLESVANEVRAIGAKAMAIACDVASHDEVDAMTRLVLEAWEAPAVLVNNAGVLRRAKVDECSVADWRHVIDVNLTGAFLVTRSFLPAMRKRGSGRIVNVSSISGVLGTPALSAYCASKWGLIGFTKSLAEELRGSGLQALSVLPGSADTEMLKGSGWEPDMTPDDVANTVMYAALDAPAAMNGASLEIFGP